MINVNKWMMALTDKLEVHFSDRLLFVGLQGSYQRGEAHDGSDIDAVVILNTLSMDDLVDYRKIILTMPEPEKACGFISGQQELANWPKYELFQFKRDTSAYHGSLEDLLPKIDDQDVIDSVRISASGLYHLCCHAAVHAPQDVKSLEGMYKSAFFLLQANYYLRNREYIQTKRELIGLLRGDEKEILKISMNWNADKELISVNTDYYFELIFMWLKAILVKEQD
jgi:hypothetical protein